MLKEIRYWVFEYTPDEIGFMWWKLRYNVCAFMATHGPTEYSRTQWAMLARSLWEPGE